jgi:hypothetical protein
MLPDSSLRNVFRGFLISGLGFDRRFRARGSHRFGRSGSITMLWPWNAGSYPGYVFTGERLKLPSGHFGLGHGGGAHAPDEYSLIESANPKIQGFDGAAMSFVEYLYQLAKER